MPHFLDPLKPSWPLVVLLILLSSLKESLSPLPDPLIQQSSGLSSLFLQYFWILCLLANLFMQEHSPIIPLFLHFP